MGVGVGAPATSHGAVRRELFRQQLLLHTLTKCRNPPASGDGTRHRTEFALDWCDFLKTYIVHDGKRHMDQPRIEQLIRISAFQWIAFNWIRTGQRKHSD